MKNLKSNYVIILYEVNINLRSSFCNVLYNYGVTSKEAARNKSSAGIIGLLARLEKGEEDGADVGVSNFTESFHWYTQPGQDRPMYIIYCAG